MMLCLDLAKQWKTCCFRMRLDMQEPSSWHDAYNESHFTALPVSYYLLYLTASKTDRYASRVPRYIKLSSSQSSHKLTSVSHRCNGTAVSASQSLYKTHRYSNDCCPGGRVCLDPKGSATESKPPRAAPQAGRPTHKVRQQHPRLDTNPDASCARTPCFSYRSDAMSFTPLCSDWTSFPAPPVLIATDM